MKKILGLVVLLALVGSLIPSCRDDIVLPEDESLVGSYEGVYIWKEGEGVNADSVVQAINWRFDETNYFMDTDTEDPLYNSEACLCKGRGTYAVTDRVRLEPLSGNPAIPDDCETCDPTRLPQGLYALEQPEGGIIMSWIQTIDGVRTTNQLILTRVSEEE